MGIYSNFTQCYRALLARLVQAPQFVSHPRPETSLGKTNEMLCVKFEIENPRDRLIYIPERNFSLSYMVAESLWYMSGSDKLEWIEYYAPFWRSVSDDGESVNSSYGHRLFGAREQSQWERVKEELKRDPESRRAVLHLKRETDSLDSRDVPCTIALQFLIRDEKLWLVALMRSSDGLLGIANDVPAFTLFQERMACELGVDLGHYVHMSNSLHIYERHFEQAERIAHGKPVVFESPPRFTIPMPAMDWDPVAIFKLSKLEASLRNGESESYLVMNRDFKKLKENIERYFAGMKSASYWADWGLILASHRARKLGRSDIGRELLKMTHFEGYHHFER